MEVEGAKAEADATKAREAIESFILFSSCKVDYDEIQ